MCWEWQKLISQEISLRKNLRKKMYQTPETHNTYKSYKWYIKDLNFIKSDLTNFWLKCIFKLRFLNFILVKYKEKNRKWSKFYFIIFLHHYLKFIINILFLKTNIHNEVFLKTKTQFLWLHSPSSILKHTNDCKKFSIV